MAGLSREDQERYRDEKLAELLNHARGSVPFWREKMEGVGEITAGNAREVLKRMPEMGRAMIQEERKRFEAEPATPSNVQHSTFNIQHSNEESEGGRCSVFGVRGRGGEEPETGDLRLETPSNVQRSTFNVQLSSGVPSELSSEPKSATSDLDSPATCNLQPATPSNVQLSSGVPSDSSSQSKIQNPKSKMGVFEDATGGSSGTPMRFLVDRATQIARESSLYWADSLAGWKYGQRVAMLWGSDKDVKSAGQALRARVRLWMDNRRWFNAFNMGEERMAEFHRAMTRFRPHVMVAYAGSLEVYARFLREKVAGCRFQVAGEDGVQCSEFSVRGRGEENFQRSTLNVQLSSGGASYSSSKPKSMTDDLDLPATCNLQPAAPYNVQHSTFNIQHSSDGASESFSQSQIANQKSQINSQSKIQNPKSKIPNYPLTALVSSAEVLTPQAREVIESVFGRPVFDRYGNREFGAIAAEDGKGGLVVNPTDVVLETNDKGELLVTYLHNFAMPFIRYNTGDLVKFREDGRLQPVAGRSADTIRTSTGKLIHGEFFTHLLYRAKEVREFQFVQETMSRYVLLLVAGKKESEDVMAGIRRDILEEIGEEAELEVRYVEEIPVLGSGKRKFTLSLVKNG